MRCPECQAANAEGRRFCRRCAAPLGQRCPLCGFANQPGDRYCGGCAAEVAAGEPVATPGETWTSADAERRQITVMFCDLVGSTALSEQLDPEDMRDLLRAYREACSAIVERYEGSIAQFRGDGILIYFGYPKAHEDDAARAIRAALEIIPAVRHIDNPWGRGGQLSTDVRIGIDTGRVVVGDLPSGAVEEYMAIVGDAPNVAARVQGYAEPGAVLITANTMRLVEGLFIADDLGAHLLHNVSHPVRIYRVREVSEHLTPFEAAAIFTPFVNRKPELALVLERWARARAEGGQVVLVAGEPGIGKSRLVQEVQEQICEQPHRWLRCQCSPYFGQSALYPVIVGLRRAAALLPEDRPDEKLTKLETFLTDCAAAAADVLPLLAAALSIPLGDRDPALAVTPERQREMTLLAIMQVLESMSAQEPLVLSVEDVHWVDPTTLELLDRLIEGIARAHILVVVTFRPEFTPRWREGSSVTLVALERLEQSMSVALIEGVTGGKLLPPELEAQLVARSEGIPLFVEELTKVVLESGCVLEEQDRFVLSGPLPAASIPSTLQDSLLARLDRLAPIKEVAQFASAIGRDFPYQLLAEIAPLTRQQLQAALDRLTGAGLIYRLPGQTPITYSFKHALVRDAAYSSMLRSRRHQLHGRIARALQAHFAAAIEQNPELLALHLTEAGLHDQAIEAWHGAGLRAIERSATLEAATHLRAGLDLVAKLPAGQATAKQEVRLQTALGAALRATQGFAAPAVVEAFERARTLCASLEDEELLLDVLPGLQSYYVVHGQLRTARELGEQLVALTGRRPAESHRLLDARRRLGWSLCWLGELTEAAAQLEAALALYDPKDHQLHIRLYGDHPGVFSHCNLAWVRWAQGRTSEADRHSEAALLLAEEFNHVLSLTYGTCVTGALYAVRGDPVAARRLADKAIPFAEDKGFPYWTAWAHIVRGWALAQSGAPEQGIAEISRGIDAYVATGGELARPFALGLLAQALLLTGQHEPAMAALDEGLQRARAREIHFCEPELLRLKGSAFLAAGEARSGEDCLRRAARSAKRQGAYAFELRALTALARAFAARGRSVDALALLAEVRSRCPDPRSTPDLEAADRLLAELGSA